MYKINIMHIITILRIIVCFQRRHKGAFEGIGSSVCCSRGKMPCLMPPAFLAAARSEGWHLPEKLIIIMCIICIIVKELKMFHFIFTHNVFLQWESNRGQQTL